MVGHTDIMNIIIMIIIIVSKNRFSKVISRNVGTWFRNAEGNAVWEPKMCLILLLRGHAVLCEVNAFVFLIIVCP